MPSDHGAARSTGAKQGNRAASGPGRTRPRTRDGFKLEATPTGDLVRQAFKGDERAWAALVARFQPMLLCIAARSGLNAADAADIEQVTWIQLMRHADQVRDPDRIAGWLATTARRRSQRAAMVARREIPSTDQVADGSPATSTNDDVETLVLRDQYEPGLERALRGLPDSYRRVLELLSADITPSYEEVAQAMDLPVGSIGPMRMRALRQVRRGTRIQPGRGDRA
jgi:RNA polymerase sigma factor (sigma-70 family)